MPGMDGLELLRRTREIDPSIQVILMTAHGSEEVGAKAFELGAASYVRKPFDRDEILFHVRAALSKREALPPDAFASPTASEMVAGSPGMKSVLELVAKVAPTNSTVLIRGESGTGKELIARALHEGSRRKSGPFIKVVCAALPETLIESELFGYERGAFTGAATLKPGRFELAEGGSLFLDEIGDLTPPTQVKLLRVLQDRQFERLGGTQTLKCDVRILCATHRDLESLVKQGTFREDLFYRINVLPVKLPPLRDRADDLPALAAKLVTRFAREHGKSVSLSTGAVDALRTHSWPGNVRELQNLLERLVILASGTIQEAEVRSALGQAPTAGGTPGTSLDSQRAEAEKAAVVQALKQTGGNRTRAAKILGVSRRTLHNKLRDYGIE
jgi:DNA-binding NtrC family response regulator